MVMPLSQNATGGGNAAQQSSGTVQIPGQGSGTQPTAGQGAAGQDQGNGNPTGVQSQQQGQGQQGQSQSGDQQQNNSSRPPNLRQAKAKWRSDFEKNELPTLVQQKVDEALAAQQKDGKSGADAEQLRAKLATAQNDLTQFKQRYSALSELVDERLSQDVERWPDTLTRMDPAKKNADNYTVEQRMEWYLDHKDLAAQFLGSAPSNPPPGAGPNQQQGQGQQQQQAQQGDGQVPPYVSPFWNPYGTQGQQAQAQFAQNYAQQQANPTQPVYGSQQSGQYIPPAQQAQGQQGAQQAQQQAPLPPQQQQAPRTWEEWQQQVASSPNVPRVNF